MIALKTRYDPLEGERNIYHCERLPPCLHEQSAQHAYCTGLALPQWSWLPLVPAILLRFILSLRVYPASTYFPCFSSLEYAGLVPSLSYQLHTYR